MGKQCSNSVKQPHTINARIWWGVMCNADFLGRTVGHTLGHTLGHTRGFCAGPYNSVLIWPGILQNQPLNPLGWKQQDR
mgnify:CR=1 FL=1